MATVLLTKLSKLLSKIYGLHLASRAHVFALAITSFCSHVQLMYTASQDTTDMLVEHPGLLDQLASDLQLGHSWTATVHLPNQQALRAAESDTQRNVAEVFRGRLKRIQKPQICSTRSTPTSSLQCQSCKGR
jgi:hypothetical protein